MRNHLSDLAAQLEAVAIQVGEIDQIVPIRDGEFPRESHLRAAMAVLQQIPCEHNAVTEHADKQDPEMDALPCTVCQFCGAELVQTWVVKR